MKEKKANNGLDLIKEKAEQSSKDWIFGATSFSCIAQIPEKERIVYLPQGEVQRGVEDMMDCASRGPVNILEAKFNWLIENNILSLENSGWLRDNNYLGKDGRITFSDAFIAINSLTTRSGNSMIAPLEAIRKQGLIPKHLLPLEPWMKWSEYHDPARITPRLKALGLEFASRILINYERVFERDFENVYKQDMIDVAGFAWPEPINGEYPRTENQPNHVFVGIGLPKHTIFDNYEETPNDFIKKLASDYDLLDFGYRLIISENKKITPPTILKPVKKYWWNKWFPNANLLPA